MSGAIGFSELERIQTIKSGSGGAIYKVIHRPTGQLYALKIIFYNKDDEIQQQIINEIEIWRGTDHPNIVKVHDVFHHKREIQILLEYMDGGSLEGAHIPDESALANLSRQILSSLVYLQSCQIVHRDIKPSNILVNSLNQVKLAYFGVTSIQTPTQHIDLSDSYMATISYTSPDKINSDLIVGEEYDWYAGSTWKFGLSILQFYLGRFPILVDSDGDISYLVRLLIGIVNSLPPEAPPTASPEFQDFIACCLQKDPASRWSAEQLLRHPFVTLSQLNNHDQEYH